MNINGFNLLSPSVQAKEVHLNLIGTASVAVPGSRGKKLAMSTDIGLIGALGLGEPLANGHIYGTEWQLALKFANASDQPVLIESIDILLHNKQRLRLVSSADLMRVYEMSQETLELPVASSRFHENLLPILLAPYSETSYLVKASLNLCYKRYLKRSPFVSVPHEAIVEPDTYRKFFKKFRLSVKTSAGVLKINSDVPLFVGQVLQVPEIKTKLRPVEKLKK